MGQAQEVEREIARLERLAQRRGVVLVADDMQQMRALLVRALAEAGFRNVRTATNGLAAWEEVAGGEVDLLLLDWNMPGLDGLTLLGRIRAEPATRDVVVLMVTGEGLAERVMEATEEGHDGYLTKPLSPLILTRRIEAAVARRLAAARARRMRIAGRPEWAVDEYMVAVANHPRSAWAWVGLGAQLLAQGRLEEAAKAYDHALEIDPGAAAAMVGLGKVELGRGRWEEALGWLHKALETAPMYLEARIELADVLLARGEGSRAVEVMEEAVQGLASARRLEHLGRVAYRAGYYPRAEQAFAQALERCRPEAGARVLIALATARMAQGKWERAAKALRQAAAAAAEHAQVAERLKALMLLGEMHLARGEPERARHSFSRLEEPRWWPGGKLPFALAHLKREVAGAWLRQGYKDEGLKLMAEAVAMAAHDSQHLARVQQVCRDCGLEEEGQRLVQARGRLKQRQMAMLEARAVALRQEGELAGAEEVLRRAVALEPTSAVARLRLGQVLWETGQKLAAREQLAQAAQLGISQGAWGVVEELARWWASQGQWAEARHLLARAMAAAPGQPQLRALAAWLRRRNKPAHAR